MKRPAFQFYPADWRKDVALQSCSMAAQGLWINAMCLAHECEPYGHLTINNKAMTPAQLGRQVGLSAKEAEALVSELIDAGVAKRNEDGTLFSRRMVADEDLRNRRAAGGKEGAEHGIKGAEAGFKGGRPSGKKGGSETPLTGFEEPPPSSSSSSSSSNNNPHTPKGVRFGEFWETWPQSNRKVARSECEKRWKARALDAEADAILAHVTAMKPTKSWQDGFEPAPLTYLNQRRWEDGATAPATEERRVI